MSNERRERQERRKRDAGPPAGCFERRRTVERRLPAAAEAELSADDFAKYFGSLAKTASKTPGNTDQLDLAADVFERARGR